MTAIGTGDRYYGRAFIEDIDFPFPVLLDEHGAAARIIKTGRIGRTTLLKPGAMVAGARALAAGNRQHRTGLRPLQLGATIVIGPGDELLFEEYEKHPGDHAELDEVLAAVGV